MFLPQSSSRRFRRDRQMLTQRHEDTKEDWSIWTYKLAVVESILFSASLPLDLRAFVPSCETLLLGGTNGDTTFVWVGSCNLNLCVDLSTKGVDDRNFLPNGCARTARTNPVSH